MPARSRRPSRIPGEAWIDEVIQYIRTNLQGDLSLAALAQAGCSSPWHLHRNFKQQTGLTPQQFVRQQRIRLAEQLLLETTSSVATVGGQAGFHGTAHFMNCFRKEAGCTPVQFRKQKLAEAAQRR
ncbi:AraC family transcriptional regulator [Paenibacillus pasadenensis]|uniref:helix-turn-helix domain-containing protein n=1 Tax=Paenibacillus pasadenensis TaxID=217090 RepID=UPI00203B1922|nr:AraC family transcriptional regulator [Paenibacillus pasadenensis]MCM3746580.1 AraC family transcriptional regulator [Paenibacillus pasadenensis]